MKQNDTKQNRIIWYNKKQIKLNYTKRPIIIITIQTLQHNATTSAIHYIIITTWFKKNATSPTVNVCFTSWMSVWMISSYLLSTHCQCFIPSHYCQNRRITTSLDTTWAHDNDRTTHEQHLHRITDSLSGRKSNSKVRTGSLIMFMVSLLRYESAENLNISERPAGGSTRGCLLLACWC